MNKTGSKTLTDSQQTACDLLGNPIAQIFSDDTIFEIKNALRPHLAPRMRNFRTGFSLLLIASVVSELKNVKTQGILWNSELDREGLDF